MRGDRRGLVHPLLPLEIQERYVADGHWTEDTFARLVAKQGSRTPDRAALVGERSFTYRDLDDAGAALAGGLRDLGLRDGGAVVAAIHCDWRAVVLTLACSRLGLRLAPLWTNASATQILRVVNALQASALLIDSSHADRDDWQPRLPSLSESAATVHTLVVSGDARHRMPAAAALFDALLEDHTPEHGFNADPAEPSLYFSTGGTTGEPKLVVQTERAALYAGREFVRLTRLAAEETFAMVGPFGHVMTNIFGIVGPLTRGATVLPEPRWRPAQVALDFRDHDVAATLVASTHLHDWLELGMDECFSGVRLMCGGGPPHHFIEQAERRWGITFLRCLGMTEAPGNMMTRLEDGDADRATDGRPYSGYEHVVVDADDNDSRCAPGELGELLVRGPSLFHGYFGRPELTAQTVTADGFYRTGDFFVETPSGCFSIVGRIKDVIRRGHNNIDPGEIEALLVRHDAIAEACVFDVPDARLSELIVAAVVPAGALPSRDELHAFLLEQGLSKPSLPDRVVAVEALPRTRIGKYDKLALKRQFTE